MANFKRRILKENYRNNKVTRKLYKTSNFKEIKEISVIDFNIETFIAYGQDYNPANCLTRDWVIEVYRQGNVSNYHETLEQAKTYLKEKLNLKIKNLNKDIDKYKKIYSNL